MSDEEIKKKIDSVLKNVSSAGKSKVPRLKKTISSIFSRKSDHEQIKKIAPLFQTTSAKKSTPPDKSIRTGFSKDKLKQIYLIARKKTKAWSGLLIKNLGFTQELTHLWGLDIGTDYIKVVRISHEEDRPDLTNFFCVVIPPRFRSGRSAYIKEMLRKLTLSYKAEGELANASIADPSLTMRLIKLPQTAEHEIARAVERRLSQQFGVDLEKELVRFTILGKKEELGVKQMEILTTSVPKEVVVARFSLIKQSGLKPIAIEPDCFSLAFCFLENYQWRPGEIIVLLNIGARYTLFNLIIDGNLNLSRKILFGSRDLLNALVNGLNISFQEAQERLDKFGIPKIDEQYSGSSGEKEIVPSQELEIFKALQTTLEKLVTEFLRTFDFYSYQMSHSTMQRIDRIFISGGATKIKNLDKFLKVRLKTPVEIFNPFQSLHLAKGINKESIEVLSSQLDLAVGLALRKTF